LRRKSLVLFSRIIKSIDGNSIYETNGRREFSENNKIITDLDNHWISEGVPLLCISLFCNEAEERKEKSNPFLPFILFAVFS